MVIFFQMSVHCVFKEASTIIALCTAVPFMCTMS